MTRSWSQRHQEEEPRRTTPVGWRLTLRGEMACAVIAGVGLLVLIRAIAYLAVRYAS